MPNQQVTLRVEPENGSTYSALAAYLAEDARKSRARLPGPQADEAIRVFSGSLKNLTDRCDRFIAGEEKQVSHLVLGKVQSGKTAHLLGTLAWTADTTVSAAVVFTGITGSLNDQTHIRLKSDLEALPNSPVVVLLVPTISQERLFTAFKNQLLELVRERVENGSTAPLPVLVTMKNAARVNAVKAAFESIATKYGSDSIFLAIDDESDQASQNAKSRSRGTAATYDALQKIRKLEMRNIWLSYTATPQAVLLTDKFGNLRPDYVAIVPPRTGYFGISDAMKDSFSNQRVVVTDWRSSARQLTSAPQSLIDAIWRFLFVAWVRKRFPLAFYSEALGQVDANARLSSTQMLIHESSMKLDHSRMFRLVGDEVARLEQTVSKIVDGTCSDSQSEALFSIFDGVSTLLDEAGANASRLLPEFRTVEGQSVFLELLRDTKIMVINSDGSSPTADEPRPVDDDDYSQHDAWILIGGDILGRGITIPQLTVSYFLRSSKTPNFDTVLQQLRFCGYRQDYKSWLSVHAPQASFEDLKYMSIVDAVVWERAVTWDKNELKISGESMPAVFYASSRAARFEPTRTGVRDPNLVDRNIGSDTIFALREIFEPRDLRANLALLRRWYTEGAIAETSIDNEWVRFDDIPVADLVRLMTSWSGEASEKRRLEAASELFDPALGSLGLAPVPTVTYVSRLLFDTWAQPEAIPTRIADIDVTRSVTAGLEGSSMREWSDCFASQVFLPPSRRATLKTPHIGGGQRTLKSRNGHNAATFIIEPILGVTETRDRNTALGVGIGFAALSPDDFEIRTIGHA